MKRKHNHTPDWDNTKIVGKESSVRDRQIRESIAIRSTKNTMNRDEGAYMLSHSYDNLLKPRPSGTHGGPRPPPATDPLPDVM